MAKGNKNKNEPLRLIRWANDGYPPIDLSNELSAILELINEVKILRKELNNHRFINNHQLKQQSV